MAYGIVHRFKGGTQEQYEAALAHAHPADGSLPAGQSLHIAGKTDDGWVVVAVFDSQASWESFRDGQLVPGLQRAGAASFSGLPEETPFEVYKVPRADG
jgi:hypothetical protein